RRVKLDSGGQCQIGYGWQNTKTQSELHVELAEYSRSVTSSSYSYRFADAGVGRGAERGGRGKWGAATGCLCFGQRIERHPDATAADRGEHAIRSRKNAHREMENRRRNQATDAGDCGIHSAQLAVGAAGNDRATEQRAGRSGGEFQALPQPGCAVRLLWFGGGVGGRFRIER